MRICIINEYFHPDNTGGTGTVLSELARSLHDDHGVEIDVITSRNLYRGDEILSPAEDWDGIRILRVASAKPNGLSTRARLMANLDFSRRALRTLFQQPRYDAVLLGTAPPTGLLAAEWYKRIAGVPYIYIVYDLEPDRAVVTGLLPQNHLAVRILGKNQRRWLHGADSIVVLGRCMRDYVGTTYNLPGDKIAVIPVGADPKLLVPGPRQSNFRKRHRLDGFVVLYSGNFGRYHDFDTILDAAARMKNSHPYIHFVLVGDGVQRKHIEQRVAGEELTNVRMFPFVPLDDYADLLATADVSLVTLEPGMEGLCVPSKFYSVLASGRPALAMMGAKCEVARVVTEENCGVTVAVGDTEQLIKAVDALVADPQALTDMGNNARNALVTKYSTTVIASQYYELLCRAANKPQDQPKIAVAAAAGDAECAGAARAD